MPIANCMRCDCEITVERSLAIRRLCKPCKIIRAKESNKRRYDACKEGRKCVSCGDPAYKTYTRCEPCHERHYRESRLQEGLFPKIERLRPKQDMFVVNETLLREYIRKGYGIQYICEKLGAKSLPEIREVSEKWVEIRQEYHSQAV
jgi:hypothetical protein